MASVAVIDQSATAGDIAVIVAQTPQLVLVDASKRDDLFAHIKREIEAFEPDVSTAKGRDAIKSFAFKITRTKTAIDDAGKKLNEEARAKISVVDAARRDARETLDELAKSVRKPLTEWEEAEKARVAQADAIINQLARDAMVSLDETAADVRARGMAVYETALDPALFGDKLEAAQKAKAHAIDMLKTALARLTREEAERAELEKLREEKAQAEAAAQAEKEKREAEEAAEAQRHADAQREADERAAEAQRIEDAKAEAAAAVQREAEEKAALVERKRAYARQMIAHIQEVGLGMIGGQSYPYGVLLHELTDKIKINDELGDMQAEVAAIRDATLVNLQAAMERQAERDKESAEREKQRAAEVAEREKLEAEELAARNRRLNQEHRAKVKTAAKAAIMTCGADEETARKIVMAIIAGEVPAVSLEF